MIDGKKSLKNLFDDAIDELEVTYEVYFEIERHRPRCLHAVNWLLSGGITNGKVLVFGENEKPFTMLFEKLGFQVHGFSLPLNYHKSVECETASSVVQKIRDLREDYDVVVCDDVLQHFASAATVLSLLKDYVRPGGMLLLTTPNVASGTSRLRLLRGRNIYPSSDNHYPHNQSPDTDAQRLMPYREYTLRELELLFKAEGFELTKKECIVGTYVSANRWPPMPVKEYILHLISLGIQKIAAPLRDYLFVAARRPFANGDKNIQVTSA